MSRLAEMFKVPVAKTTRALYKQRFLKKLCLEGPLLRFYWYCNPLKYTRTVFETELALTEAIKHFKNYNKYKDSAIDHWGPDAILTSAVAFTFLHKVNKDVDVRIRKEWHRLTVAFNDEDAIIACANSAGPDLIRPVIKKIWMPAEEEIDALRDGKVIRNDNKFDYKVNLSPQFVESDNVLPLALMLESYRDAGEIKVTDTFIKKLKKANTSGYGSYLPGNFFYTNDKRIITLFQVAGVRISNIQEVISRDLFR